MDVKPLFGENLKRRRREKKLSQEQLAEKTGISVKHLSAIERGLTFVSAELLEKLSQALETPLFFFFAQDTAVFYDDSLLNAMDRIIEKHLIRAIEAIKLDIRHYKEQA
jgi:transcriptional regulator with XRE-family HTH domain